jgi:tetratricopeptide (TPR) repeat protein
MNQAQAEAMLGDAFAALDRHDVATAMRIGEELKTMKHSAGFEVLSQAWLARGDVQKALDALQEGVRLAPQVWLLWQSMGNLLSSQQMFKEAHEAYGRALVCPDADVSTIHFNRSLAYAQQRDFASALRCLDLVKAEYLRFKAGSFRVAALNDLGRSGEAAQAASDLLAAAAGQAVDAEDLARLYAQSGKAAWLGSKDAQSARQAARQALSVMEDEPTALWLLREVDGEHAEGRRYYRLDVGNRLYEVVATSLEAALQLAQNLANERLELRGHKQLEFDPKGPTGVYRIVRTA